VYTAEQQAAARRVLAGAAPLFERVQVAMIDLGRGATKHEKIKEVVADIESHAMHLHALIDPYSSGHGCRRDSGGSGRWDRSEVVAQATAAQPQVAKDLDSSKLKFLVGPTFDPARLYDDFTRSFWLDPDVLLRDDTVALPHVRVRGARSDVLDIVRKLDAVGLITIFRPHEIVWDDACGSFSVTNNAEKDRLIVDARVRNAKEYGVADWTFAMASGTALTDIYIPSGFEALVTAEDLPRLLLAVPRYAPTGTSQRSQVQVLAG